MTRRRWIADEVAGDNAFLTGEHADHLIRVLRARVGQEFDIVAGTAVRRSRVVNIGNGRVEFELGEVLPSAAASNVVLLLSVFKFDRMEWAIEKATELGVSRIIPVVARRTDAHLASAAEKRVERWNRIARQASEQSRRAAPPEILAPLKLRDALGESAPLKVVLAESEQQILLRDVFAEHIDDASVLLAVGPEGGWTDDELQAFHESGWRSASLGRTVLRAETAAIAAVVIAFSELGGSLPA